MEFVWRSERTEHDDYVLNVEPKLDKYSEALPIYDKDNPEILLGWKIQSRYE